MPFLREALRSLEKQTSRDFEVLLWDNGSTDGSVAEANRWIPGKLPGRVITDRPLPLEQCLAALVEESNSDFIARMDGDDICLPERLERQLTYLQDNPDVAVLGTQMEIIAEDGQTTGRTTSEPEAYRSILATLLFRNPIAHPTVVVRRDAILSSGNYKRTKPTEDYDLWLSVARQFTIENLPEVLLRYRRHSGAVCGDLDAQNEQLYALGSETVSEHSERLFGIRPEVALELRNKSYQRAVGPLVRAARNIAARSSVPTTKVLLDPHFIRTARSLTNKQDLVSKATWRLLSLISGDR